MTDTNLTAKRLDWIEDGSFSIDNDSHDDGAVILIMMTADCPLLLFPPSGNGTDRNLTSRSLDWLGEGSYIFFVLTTMIDDGASSRMIMSKSL